MRKKKNSRKGLYQSQVINRLWSKSKILGVGNKWRDNDKKMLNNLKYNKLRK